MSLDARLRHPHQPTEAVMDTPVYPVVGTTRPTPWRISVCAPVNRLVYPDHIIDGWNCRPFWIWATKQLVLV